MPEFSYADEQVLFFFFLRFPLSAVFQTTAYKSLLKTSKHTHTHTQEKGYLENCAQVACAVFGFMFLASHTCVTGVCEWTSNLKRKEHNNHRKNNSNDILFRPQWDWTQEKIACVCACVFRWAGTCGCEADWASFLKRNGSIGSLSRRTHIIFYLKVRGSLHAVNCTADADGEKPCAAVYFFILFFTRCFTTAFTPIFPFLFFSFSYLSVNTHYFHQLKRQQGETLRRTSTCFCFQQNTIFIALGKKKTDFFFFSFFYLVFTFFFCCLMKKKKESFQPHSSSLFSLSFFYFYTCSKLVSRSFQVFGPRTLLHRFWSQSIVYVFFFNYLLHQTKKNYFVLPSLLGLFPAARHRRFQ